MDESGTHQEGRLMLHVLEKACRSCGSASLVPVVDFGITPLADRLLTTEQLTKDDLRAPLSVIFCDNCALVQIRETVAPEVLFYADYLYFSSVSPSLMAHFRESALSIIDSRKLGPKHFVVEAASNDGYMLRNFLERGIPVLGIEPAGGAAKAARDLGIEMRKLFFTAGFAKELRGKFPAGAEVFLANNVLAPVPDLNGFVKGIHTILNSRGLAVMVIEAPYAPLAFHTSHGKLATLTAVRPPTRFGHLGLRGDQGSICYEPAFAG